MLNKFWILGESAEISDICHANPERKRTHTHTHIADTHTHTHTQRERERERARARARARQRDRQTDRANHLHAKDIFLPEHNLVGGIAEQSVRAVLPVL